MMTWTKFVQVGMNGQNIFKSIPSIITYILKTFTDIFNKMNVSETSCCEKQIKDYILYQRIIVKLQKRQKLSDREQIGSFLGPGVGLLG